MGPSACFENRYSSSLAWGWGGGGAAGCILDEVRLNSCTGSLAMTGGQSASHLRAAEARRSSRPEDHA